MDAFRRVAQLIGEEKAERLKTVKVAVFGIGGVGGFAVEALARSGVGNLLLVDNDVVEESNINRQIIATTKTLGKNKTDVMKERVLSINPSANVEVKTMFYLPESSCAIDLSDVDYVIDAVDTVTAKVHVIKTAREKGINVITCMGTAGKTDISALKISTVEKTSVCPLAKTVRRELNRLGISGVKAVYSTEPVVAPVLDGNGSKHTPPSMIFVPATAGLMLASEVIKDLTQTV